jgi:hypothetical protein
MGVFWVTSVFLLGSELPSPYRKPAAGLGKQPRRRPVILSWQQQRPWGQSDGFGGAESARLAGNSRRSRRRFAPE